MLEYYEQLTAEVQEQIKNIIRALYSQTYILERKYDRKAGRVVSNRDFYFCGQHMEFLKKYFAIAGIILNQNTDLGVIYVQGETAMGERFPKLATIYLLLFKLMYDEKMAAASASVNIITTFGELNAKVGEFRLTKNLSSVTEMKRSLALLKRYQMIEIMDTLEELEEQTRIIIYPSIHVVLMRDDMIGLLHSFAAENEGDVSDGEKHPGVQSGYEDLPE